MRYKVTTNILLVSILLQVIQSLFPHFINFQAFRLSDFEQQRTFWRGISCILVHMVSHASWDHLLGNFSLGIPCLAYMEYRLGSAKMLQFYVITGVGALVTALSMPVGGDALIGSSGAIFGCLAGSCMLWGNTKATKKLSMFLLLLWLLPQLMALSISLMGGHISNSAHIGGMLTAIIYLHITRGYDRRRSNKAMRGL